MTRKLALQSFVITIIAMVVCVIFGGGGRGTYVLAIFIFPFSMRVAIAMDRITNVAIALTFVQFPVYALDRFILQE